MDPQARRHQQEVFLSVENYSCGIKVRHCKLLICSIDLNHSYYAASETQPIQIRQNPFKDDPLGCHLQSKQPGGGFGGQNERASGSRTSSLSYDGRDRGASARKCLHGRPAVEFAASRTSLPLPPLTSLFLPLSRLKQFSARFQSTGAIAGV